jgi:hypothetical protein
LAQFPGILPLSSNPHAAKLLISLGSKLAPLVTKGP